MKGKYLSISLCLLGFALAFKITDTWLEQIYNIPSLWVVASAIGYFLGSIPFGYILTSCFAEQDIRKIGSGNIGATNVLRTGQKKLAAITLFLDLMKGVLAVYAIQYWMQPDPIAPLIAGGSALIGHCHPVWLRFKGGKGVATAAGVVFALSPFMGMIGAAVWGSILFTTRYSSLASLGACLSTPITAYMMDDFFLFIFTLCLTALVFIRHHSNIRRLLKGKESKIGC